MNDDERMNETGDRPPSIHMPHDWSAAAAYPPLALLRPRSPFLLIALPNQTSKRSSPERSNTGRSFQAASLRSFNRDCCTLQLSPPFQPATPTMRPQSVLPLLAALGLLLVQHASAFMPASSLRGTCLDFPNTHPSFNRRPASLARTSFSHRSRSGMPRVNVVQRRAMTTMMAGGGKVKVGIVGATGAVGEEIVKVRGPWQMETGDAKRREQRTLDCIEWILYMSHAKPRVSRCWASGTSRPRSCTSTPRPAPPARRRVQAQKGFDRIDRRLHMQGWLASENYGEAGLV